MENKTMRRKQIMVATQKHYFYKYKMAHPRTHIWLCTEFEWLAGDTNNGDHFTSNPNINLCLNAH